MNALCGIGIFAVVVFTTGLPLAYYAARYNIDLDLITRGSGFGYYGSVVTNVIFATFTFIFFALEARSWRRVSIWDCMSRCGWDTRSRR
ncbi:putative two-component sensor kinase domain protein [Mycobacterium kansasii]|uniref:Putative two-component sensor kinase domain protein n=1 Tax=Mycobacterium kansasii TaxID=1768 RepID=A0A1V3WKJ5_MYCKA|nr:putative two-component sensor kinase domain protein [Mycobacterium kansasii]